MQMMSTQIQDQHNTTTAQYTPAAHVTNLAVTWDHRAVRCDTCDQWFHINCQDIHSGTYSYLTADENTALRWDCIVCDSPNYNSLCYGSTSIQTENSFSPLENTLNNSTETQNRKPLHSSTPKRNNVKEKHKPFTPLRILNVNCQSIRNTKLKTS
ncbi:unnamed protein product [Mytilus coruscus]|uniref:PHD-type domain-containing protein n=1 Tax=Mytilus coruscus TaxID=42192 RepID=A0A6J8ARA5_MYTCO|nr:unnamed protein product [Mytilus coruscus]